jgi:hypothetical protein
MKVYRVQEKVTLQEFQTPIKYRCASFRLQLFILEDVMEICELNARLYLTTKRKISASVGNRTPPF